MTDETQVAGAAGDTQDAAPESVESAVLRAFEEVEKAEASDDVADKAPPADKPEAKPDTSGRVRGPDGKFAPADKAPDQTAKPAEQAKPAGIVPPQHWSATDKEMFGKIAPEGQAWIMGIRQSLERDHQRKTQALAEARKGKEELDRYVESRRQQALIRGTTPERELQEMGAWADLFRQDKVMFGREILSRLMKAGVTPEQLIGSEAEQQQDPRLTAYEQRLQQIERGLMTHAQMQEQEQARQAEALTAQNLNALSAIRQERDAAGNLLRPYFDHPEVKAEMMLRINGWRSLNPGKSVSPEQIKSFYNVAIRSVDSIHQATTAAQREREAAEAAQKRAQEADAAKRSSVSVTTSPAMGGAGRTKPKTVEEAVMAAWDKHAA